MKSLNRTNQGGSVTSFVIIGLFLVIGLASSVYLFNYRIQQVRNDQLLAQQITDEKNKKPTETETGSVRDKTDTKKTEDTQNNSPIVSQNSKELPATGIEDVVLNSSVLCLITYFAVSYFMSRRNLTQPL